MVRISVCVETVFPSLALAEQVDQAAACGAAAVEFGHWQDMDLDTVARAKEAAGVDVATLGALRDAPANDPARSDDAVAEALAGLEAARQIGAKGLVVHAGRTIDRVGEAEQFGSVARVLSAVAVPAAAANVMLLLEPRNARKDCPGSVLTRTEDAMAILDEVGEPNVKMLFDVYHQYITEGSVLTTIESHIERIGHVHVADVPGRGEPGTGALDFGEIFKLIDSLEYGGYVGLEFHPSGDPAEAVRKTIDLTHA
jgi:hydroxypyruvate isomerase